ncbi:BZ3500_MvSof-1268-A1-R1_Chr3-2g06371 [Microbotryum saponariae]|uniref:BZ3500_MvSof-1268-A1-R1_Chr3-2g06371 protein n=1 Tax=Microbotryum saponariae TaxID=289078 RepID=A0A2X0NAB6_9BASI|nr:BZ3500_MvSof-1268-A1-R1_Chr3-2g06371 [Microbotryum saponariae]SDA04342.1 BZ3501_MvSof-1269-A2-R1_Chr3-2g06062 [Microbotryum saponariae]
MTGFTPAHGDPSNITSFQGAGTAEEAEHELYQIVPEVSACSSQWFEDRLGPDDRYRRSSASLGLDHDSTTDSRSEPDPRRAHPETDNDVRAPPDQVNIVHLAITLLSIFVTFFGLFSGFVKERLYVGEAIIATGFGVAFSGYGAGVFAPRSWSSGHHFDDLTLELTRIVIALSVFAVGVELPKAYILRHWRSLSMLLGPIMLLGWMVSAALMFAIIPGLEFLPALVIAAGVTPTDPILASSVVGKGKFAQEHVPAHIRHILQAESGCNDGAAFPFLYLALFLLLRGHHTIGEAIGWWALLVLLYQIVLGCVIGAAVGIAARKLLKFSKRRELIDRESMVAMYVALALLVTGLTTLAGSDDLLAAFACGTAFAWDDWFTESIEESNFSSTIDLLANCAIFIYLGATMPFAAWSDEMLTLTVWRLVLLSLGILTLRRLPAIFALQWWIPDIKTRREALFAGHFGPMGVGAIFISTLAAAKLPTPTVPPENSLDLLALIIQPVTYFIVLSSILIHGLTISFFTLGRRVHSRVASFSRTLTSASRDSRGGLSRNAPVMAEEPAWMSRVKRAQRGEDIIINRDDDLEPTSMAEKGLGGSSSSEFGSNSLEKAPVGDGSDPEDGRGDVSRMRLASMENDLGRGEVDGERRRSLEDESHGISLDEEDLTRTARIKKKMEQENDDHPRKNILEHVSEDGSRSGSRDASLDRSDRGRRQSAERPQGAEMGRSSEAAAGKRGSFSFGSSKDSKSPSRPPLRQKDSAREARYCSKNVTQTWQQGRKIIIDRNDGAEVEVIDLDATPDALEKSARNDRHEILTVPQGAIEREKEKMPVGDQTPQQHEESAVQRVAQAMLRSRSMLATATAKLYKEEPNLSAEEKERRRKEKLEKDAWCRKEQHYPEIPAAKRRETQEWPEGEKVVVEHTDGTVDVRDMTEEEKNRRITKHLGALRALGHPIEALEGRGKRRSPAPTASPSLRAEEEERDPSALWGRPIQGPGPASSSSSSPRTRNGQQHSSNSPARSETPPPVARKPNTGFALERTGRLDPDSEEEAASEDEDDARDDDRTATTTRERPESNSKSGGAFKSVKGIFGLGSSKRSASPPPAPRPVITRIDVAPALPRPPSPPPPPSKDDPVSSQMAFLRSPGHSPTTPISASTIRFADASRPMRDGAGPSSGLKPLPTIGNSSALRRNPTQGSSKGAQ